MLHDPATQVGLRPFESGLGGHEKGVWGVDEGVENASHPLWERVRTALSGRTTFSDFVGVDYEMVDANRNDHNETASRDEYFVTPAVNWMI